MKYCLARAWLLAYANDIDAFIPELWANESLMILEENMVLASLVHRDFEPIIAQFGDIVNTRKPADFTAKRKTNADSVTVQDATAANVAVPLDQHFHVSFLIKDGEDSKSFKQLVEEFVRPAMIANARAVDTVLSGQVYQFLANAAGDLETAADKAAIIDTRRIMNENKVIERPRNLVVGTQAEADLLNVEAFTDADRVGDDGTALREASLGRKFGFDIFMAQNTPEISSQGTIVSGTLVNEAGGSVKGDTTITVDGGTVAADIPLGSWVQIAGDDAPQRVTAIVGDPVTELTIAPGLYSAIVDNAAVTVYDEGEVDGLQAVGFAKEITVDGFVAGDLEVGRLVAFGVQTQVYAIIEVNGIVGITLDRPLDLAIADNDNVNVGPEGSFNFAFHRNALALVNRPLAVPRAGTGALSAVSSLNNISMRSVITYDGDKQGHLVTLDLLVGVKPLDVALGAVMLSA